MLKNIFQWSELDLEIVLYAMCAKGVLLYGKFFIYFCLRIETSQDDAINSQ